MPEHNTSAFGRGWIPTERDIGLPGGDPVLRLARPFTPERRVRFLHLLATTGNVRRACHAVGVSPQAAYVHKRRDAAFAAGWDAALLLARDAAEEVLAERALHGTQETIFYRGEAVGSRLRFDARLLLAHLARLDRHHEQAEAAAGIAARFDEYLAELQTGEPKFAADFHDPDGPPQWSPAHRERAAVLQDARDVVVYRFPKKAADIPEEMLADCDTTGVHPADLWSHALDHAQRTAETTAAETWDTAAKARLAALDAVLEAEEEPEVQMASDLPDPPLQGEGTRPEGGEGVAPTPETGKAPPDGETPLDNRIETKACKSPLRTLSTVSTSARTSPRRAAAARLHRMKSSAVSTPSVEATKNETVFTPSTLSVTE